MSDLRNQHLDAFNSISNPAADAGHIYREMHTGSIDESILGAHPVARDTLSDFHLTEAEESNSSGRILASLIVALMLGAAGVYAYTTSGSNTPLQVASNEPVKMAAPRAATPITPQQAANDTGFAPTESDAPTPIDATPAASEPVSRPVVAPASSASSKTRSRTASASRPPVAAPATDNSVDERANATTQAIQQSFAANAAQRSAPALNLNSTPDVTNNVETIPQQTVAPTLPSEQPAPDSTPVQ